MFKEFRGGGGVYSTKTLSGTTVLLGITNAN